MFIKQASELSGATQRAIRLYESLGLLTVSRTGKYRVYTERNINLIKMIKEGQALGIHLSEMVNLKNERDDFDWTMVRDFLILKQQNVEIQIKVMEEQREKIKRFRESMEECLQGIDSDL